MISKAKHDESDWHEDKELCDRILIDGFNREVKKAIALHHFEGRSVAIVKDGNRVWLHPDRTTSPNDSAATESSDDDI